MNCNLDRLIFENADNVTFIVKPLFVHCDKILEIVATDVFKKKYGKYFSTKMESNSGCYIATCVYGSYDCPEVWILRRFRDYTLDPTWYGRLFVKCYYAISPTLVKCFGKTKWFRVFWQSKLDMLVAKLKRDGVADTYYNDKYRRVFLYGTY